MANLVALGMKSLGVHIETDGATSEKVEDAFHAVEGIVSKEEGDVFAHPGGTGALQPHDMNIAPMNMSQHSYGYAVELVDGYEGEVDKAKLDPILKAGNYNELPELIKPKTDVGFGFFMSLAFVPQPDGKTLVVKLYSFSKRQTPKIIKDRLASGDLFMVDNGETANKMVGLRVFHYLFERLGGLQYRYWSWPTPVAKEKSKDKSDEKMSTDQKMQKLQEGFDYIEKHCPKANLKNSFTVWTEMHVIDEKTPIFGWRKELVKESLTNYAKSNQLQMKKDD